MRYPRLSRVAFALLAGLLLTGSALAFARPAAASQGWCWDDPVVQIGPHRVDIANGVFGEPAEVDKNVKQAINTIYVPRNVPVELVSYTKTYFKDKKVIWERTDETWTPGQAIPVTVVTTYKAKQEMPARTVATYPGGSVSADGTTFIQTTVKFTLPATNTN